MARITADADAITVFPATGTDDADHRSELADSGPCGQYRVGHDLHPIQCRIAVQGPAVPATVTVGDAGWLHLVTADGVLDRWVHHPVEVQRRIAAHGPCMEVRASGVLAQAEADAHGGTASWWAVSIAEEPTPCPGGDAAEVAAEAPRSVHDLVEQVRAGRGFLLSGDDLAALTDHEDQP